MDSFGLVSMFAPLSVEGMQQTTGVFPINEHILGFSLRLICSISDGQFPGSLQM